MEALLAFAAFVFWFVCLFTSTWIGKSKGRALLGFGLGVLLGPLGCLIIVMVDEPPDGESRTGSDFFTLLLIVMLQGMAIVVIAARLMEAERASTAQSQWRDEWRDAQAEVEKQSAYFSKDIPPGEEQKKGDRIRDLVKADDALVSILSHKPAGTPLTSEERSSLTEATRQAQQDRKTLTEVEKILAQSKGAPAPQPAALLSYPLPEVVHHPSAAETQAEILRKYGSNR